MDPRSIEGATDLGRQMARSALAVLADPVAEGAGAALLVDPVIVSIERIAAEFVQAGMEMDDALAWMDAVRAAFSDEIERLTALVRLSPKRSGSA